MTTIIIEMIVITICAYLIGSIPTGWLITKKLTGQDIRETGSGSTGATNVKRALGTKWFFIVMVLDALKGFIPVYLAIRYFDFIAYQGLTQVLVAAAVVLGHSKSVFLKFSGGKSVASNIGGIIALCWPVGLIMAAIWGFVSFSTKYVSLGSVITVVLSPVLMQIFHQPTYYFCYSALCAAYIVYLHRDNIRRLLKKKENKVRE